MEIAVKDICQTASGGSYYVKFRAEFDLLDSTGVTVSVASSYPDGVDQNDINDAANAIRDGFDAVLGDRGMGASVVVHDLGIHIVDFKIYKFRQATERFLRDYLYGNASS